MVFKETKLKGAYIIEIEPAEDERGFFARSCCQKEFEQHGLDFCIVQCNLSYNKKRGTLRGMHYQAAPYEEAKLVRCSMGAVYDVMIDLRPESSTFKQWVAEELTAQNCKMLYIPEGFAHGFLTLEDNTTVFYQVSEFYHSECERGVRWDDPVFGIEWPSKNYIISAKDRQFPDFIQ
ncbi:dTDP-4-dehydrorhamnose 3,5-epimerase [Chloroflexota bacterium]